MTDTGALPTRRGPSWPVVGVVAFLVAVSTFASFKLPTEAGTTPIDDVAIACGIVGALGILLWRTSVWAMVAITSIAMFTYTALDYPGGPALLPGPVMLVALGSVAPRRTAWMGAVTVMAAVTVGRWIGDEPFGVGELLVIGWSSAAVLAGQAIRARTDRVAAERERRVQLERQAVADERLRIAQDLHDSVAHAMATINVQSGVAAHLIDRRPEQAREALEAIRAASADVLDELGAILGVLREPDEAAPRSPTSRLDDIDALVDRARADGLAVSLVAPDPDRRVSAAIGAAAFRVVQEALTNVHRHAGPGATATVTIDRRGGGLAITVVDDGGRDALGTREPGPRQPATRQPATHQPVGSPAIPPGTTDPTGSPRLAAADARGGRPSDRARGGDGPGTGFGLIGMRERVESSGGTLVTGPRDGGGFEVRATWAATA